MTAWFYLIVFILLNVFIYMGMEKITRHLARMSGQLDTLVSLLRRLTEQLGEQERRRLVPEGDEGGAGGGAVGAGAGDRQEEGHAR